MKALGDVYRQTFPKKLRFDKACQILHAEVFVVARRHKHRKYVPKGDIYDVLDRYEPLPGSPWIHLPVVRHVLLIRQINGVRCLLGKRSWLINRAVEEEHHRIKQWMATQEQLGAKAPKGSRLGSFVERERFVAEVLEPFHVATMYQRMVRLGAVLVIVLLLLTFASVNLDGLVYLYAVHWCRMRREDVLAWFREITERHAVTEVPPAYESLLPPPCVLRSTANGRERYDLKITELVSPNEKIVVMAIPCPQVGEKKFFAALGEVAALCDAVMMEGVPFERIDKIVPAALFPLRDDTFPALGLHHRFLDVVRGRREPPFLYPAASELSWRAYWMQLLAPFEMRCVYWPTAFSASKGEARICWGRLRELIEQAAAQQKGGGSDDSESYVICLPWTVHQIVNLEASLLRYGFRVRRVFPLEWLDRDHMGEHFCNYYGIP
ncbi:hypothetical protein DQ04_01151110 [Trypanosoma grayi]|uniref:hypothetical protein n=1 Tax=Trypanosoma grayi TaxID=71804 RepID=UPI0004F43489|nr:hypothetical protein DQ04_01151110 [Trypanosoma grayi]KEG13204.1 hypothetical protein DQ04_01151110 [Trypanosoma grayi]